MPGVPKSLGCEACRKQKKGCDKAKPICARCKRLGIECIGSGLKRFKFIKNEAQIPTSRVVPAPRPGPSNDTTRVCSALVFILQVKDIRHDVRSFGGRYFFDLPKRIGSSKALEMTVSALVTAYDAIHGKQHRVNALAKFGSALEHVRTSLKDPTLSVATKMYGVFNIYICQEWIGSDDPTNLARHREALAHMFKDAVIRGRAAEIEPSYVYGLCQIVAYESLVNPNVKIDPWFWEILDIIGKTRPLPYQQGHSYQSVDLETYAGASFYFREPKRYRYQLECIYNLVHVEMPRLRQDVLNWMAAAMAPAVGDVATQLLVQYETGYGVLLSVGARVNRVLRKLGHDDKLIADSYKFCDEAIWLAKESATTRPFGSHFVPKFLRLIYATTADGYRQKDMEALILDYEKDWGDSRYLIEAKWLDERFEMMEAMGFERERKKASPFPDAST